MKASRRKSALSDLASGDLGAYLRGYARCHGLTAALKLLADMLAKPRQRRSR